MIFTARKKMKKFIKIVGINLLVLSVLLAALEIILRVLGMTPIFFLKKDASPNSDKYRKICQALRQGKDIRVFPGFFTDSSGIFRAAANASPAGTGNSMARPRVNSSGFRGNEFTYLETEKTKIFFIGDSFTWGSAAKPIEESFPDLVEKAGYYVFNGGMPGTDPQQYARLAEKYVPLLKPDVTAVCLYLGNDLKNYTVPMLANQNLHYSTSVGFIRGYDDQGNYFKNADQAIAYLKKQKCGCTENLGDTLLYKTVIGKAVYGLFHLKSRLTPDPRRKWVVDCLQRIGRVCRDNRSQFILLLIPNKNPKKNKNNLKLVASFPGIVSHYPGNFISTDYRPAPDNHFNNQGHGKFARFILKIMLEKGFLPVR